MLNADNGWNFMEAEMIGHQGAALNASVGYHLGDFNFTLFVQNPFLAHPKVDSSELVNALVQKQMDIHSAVQGNMLQLTVAWRINRGKKYPFSTTSLVSPCQMCGRKNTPIVRLCICENCRTFAAVNI